MFMVNRIDIRKFGSQGQQRTAAMSLKLSEIYLVKKKSKIRRYFFWMMYFQSWTVTDRHISLDSIHDIQTLITCTGLDDFVSHQFHINKVFKVVKGEVFNPVN